MNVLPELEQAKTFKVDSRALLIQGLDSPPSFDLKLAVRAAKNQVVACFKFRS